MDKGKTMELDCSDASLDVIEITESEDENVIELTSSASDTANVWVCNSVGTRSTRCDADASNTALRQLEVPGKSKIKIKMQSGQNLHAKTPVTMEPLYVDDENEPEDHAENDDDDAILVLNEPKSARRPIKISSGLLDVLDGETRRSDFTDLSKDSASNHRPRKRDTVQERAKRVTYAEELFSDLNEAIFRNGLPKDTKLTWNKRLLTTAGRAKWRRNKEGHNYTEIELSEKILDCNERIRNTLSHEMCHLATWIIDADPKQAHGRLWKRWAAKVMKKRPDIEITTRHNYEISYPYQWKCEKCAKIYGRFSKSIHPDQCVCGSCKEGRLLPLFLLRKRTRKMSSTDKETPVKPRIPFSTISCESPSDRDTGLDSESEVEILLMTLQNVTLQ